jgi:hypothetical protein
MGASEGVRGFNSYSLSVPRVGLGLEGSAAEEDGGAELCSAAPPDVSALPDDGFVASTGFASLAAPDDGGAELCSLAPVDVSAPPDGGVVTSLDFEGVLE